MPRPNLSSMRRSQINCLGASRSKMLFSHGTLPLTLISGRNMNGPLRANVFDFLDGISSKESYYILLGVSKYSTFSELKRAYRRLAMTYHPDVNKDDPDAAAKFIDITHAYEVLLQEKKADDDICEDEVITPIKRTRYDWYSLKTLMAKCTTCGGQGQVYISVKNPPLGVKQQAITCSSCSGTGHVFDLRTSDIS
ncbi:chaperone protein dnaJ A6, chloroplastic isoform X2 [Raphanus sativus]|uniref:Chaperone protein dnaJ A6, chloroplastic isoform X2 n=1 Tax=Raphanus sativus TaxID=3726 RepID=A0A6J0N9P0_RAPSA|nr:chaperone protein dnaJ A6, chloroplastic isoform X2 [Raphanus sativus]